MTQFARVLTRPRLLLADALAAPDRALLFVIALCIVCGCAGGQVACVLVRSPMGDPIWHKVKIVVGAAV